MIYIRYPSALEFWLTATGRSDVRFPYIIHEFIPSIAVGRWNGDINLHLPVSVMVEGVNQRRLNSLCKCTAAPAHLPENSFMQVADSICVESPEMCFLEAARFLKFHYLVELGNCLCANYVIDTSSVYSQRSRQPITSAEKIADFLNSASGFRGVKLAKRSAKYIQNGSGSPGEVKINAFFFISFSDGGQALKTGWVNGRSKLTPDAIDILGTSQCRVDILWEDDKVAFEYDSMLAHANDRQRQYDARRRMALEKSGYKVITFTNDTIARFSDSERAVAVLREGLGMRKKTAELEKYRLKRLQVYTDLFKTPHTFFPM